MVSKALDCITTKLDDIQDPYTISLVTYALVVANHSKADVMMARLKKKAKTSQGKTVSFDVYKQYTNIFTWHIPVDQGCIPRSLN